MADAIIEVKDVEFRYEGAEEEAVAGVSLRVERGEFVAVLGRNGSAVGVLRMESSAVRASPFSVFARQ